ncbi:hypothetical protein [Streptomyces sp. NPDC014006]|uniref:hypothetical protein n=1 Tax=Streptomyces sp. NPDC014006 TaxID=3364870 RepID=UPI0036F87CFE
MAARLRVLAKVRSFSARGTLAAMGLDITVLIANRSWLEQVPPQKRVERLRDAWYDDETGLWDETPRPEDGWAWPQGPDGAFFAAYEFRHTLGSFKPHFWAGHRWERVRDHVDLPLRTELDTFLLGLIWDGLDGEPEHLGADFFGEASYGVLLALSPENVRELAATWDRVLPHLHRLQGPFAEHAAVSDGWISDFDAFADLLTQWGDVLTEAARRAWCVVGVSE